MHSKCAIELWPMKHSNLKVSNASRTDSEQYVDNNQKVSNASRTESEQIVEL